MVHNVPKKINKDIELTKMFQICLYLSHVNISFLLFGAVEELGSPGALPEEGPSLGAIMLPRALWSGRGIGFSGCFAGRGTHVGRQNVTGVGGVSSPVT
jgi:hypothetical protein